MRIVFRETLFVFLLISVAFGSALAEDPSALQSGTRIRATYVEHSHGETRNRKIIGNIAELTDCTLSLFKHPGDDAVFLPRENITRLERSVHPPRQDRWLKRGLVLGSGIGVVASIILTNGESASGNYAGLYVLPIGLGAIAGAALGTLFDSGSARGEQWEEIGLNSIAIGFDAEPGNGSHLLVGFRF